MRTKSNLLEYFGNTPFERVENASKALNKGMPVLLVDDENRENEGDLIIAAEKLTPEMMNFIIRNGSGIACLAITDQIAKRLELPLMIASNDARKNVAAFTVSIEASEGVTTGVSAADRTQTILTAISDSAKPSDLARPGHVFPVIAHQGGVLERAGHTEGSIDLMKIASLKPASVICELMNADGTMARLPNAVQFAKKHDLTILSIPDIIMHRRNTNSYIKEQAA